MGSMTRERVPGPARRGRLLATVAGACLILLAACAGPTANSPSSEAAPPSAGATSSASGPPAPAPSRAATATQTDTAWGRIWDRVPEAFPTFVGATPAGAIEAEPASASLAVEGADPREIIAWMQMQLERATFATEALNGPLEGGSYVLESSGSGDCRIQVVVGPLGGLSSIVVRYGAACPEPN